MKHYNDGGILLFQGHFDKLGASYGFVSIWLVEYKICRILAHYCGDGPTQFIVFIVAT